MIRTIAAAAAVLALAGTASAQTPPAHDTTTVNVQGPQGPFADPKVMTPFYEILRDAHNQGDKADLDAMEEKIRALVPTLMGGGHPPSKAMEDHVLGVAHQALAMGVGNPKMFASYKDFMEAMLGPS